MAAEALPVQVCCRVLEVSQSGFYAWRTVEWHLRKVFTMLDISSRRQLRVALPEGSRPLARA
jgi:hypothetical protein